MTHGHKIIKQLVDENFVYAKILHYFGVNFYENREKTLKIVCAEHNIDEVVLDNFLKGINTRTSFNKNQLSKYPIRLIIEYLKHSHQIFIKDKLTYILKLINAIDGKSKLIDDLKFVLPMFVEDFIKHIYEEEDKLFVYIIKLETYLKNPNQLSNIEFVINQFHIQEFVIHHKDSDQEMKGIRGITFNYDTNEIDDIHLKVILKELKHFDEVLTKHAIIENELLFPKAILLEKLLLAKIKNTSIFN